MALFSYEIGVSFTATGTAETTAASTAVEGTGTDFIGEFAEGDLIIVAGETRVVETITDGDSIVVTENFTVGSGGGAVAFTGVGLTNIESLLTTTNPGDQAAPRSFFVEFSKMLPLGNARVRGLGWSQVLWKWGFVSQLLRNALRTYSTTASNAVYIRSREDDTSRAYQYYSCTLIWPTGKENSQVGRVLDFTLAFSNAVEVSVA